MFKDDFIAVARAHHLRLKSERSYWCAAAKHIRWLKAKSASDLARDPTGQFRRYLTEMANENPNRSEGDEGVSGSTQNLAFHALRFLYEKVIGVQLGDLSGIPKAPRYERIVDVPTDELANRIVSAVPGRCGLALRTIRATAGRLNDIIRLRVKDLDFKRRIIAIQDSKGGKARIVPMADSLVRDLEMLTKERDRIHESDLAAGYGWVHMPGKLAAKYPAEQKAIGWQYLFFAEVISRDPITGNLGRHHILDTTLQRAFANARKKLRIKRHYTIHGLRHCTSQFWERNGVPISEIQTLLGHEKITTTQRYLKSGIKAVPKVPSPI